MISAAIERCAGIDVGKKFLAVCVMVGPLEGEPRVEIRKFGTIRVELERLRDWLKQQEATHVVMESTGSYWKPVFNALEDAVKVYLANPQEVKNRKGHKTDNKDGWWLAHLLRHAMIHPSFIPPRTIRELRDLTRHRKRLLGAGTSERNRVQKVLEQNDRADDLMAGNLRSQKHFPVRKLRVGEFHELTAWTHICPFILHLFDLALVSHAPFLRRSF